MVTELKGRLWFRLEAGYEDDVSMWGLPPLAELLWVRSISWSKDNDTDGFLPAKALVRAGIRIGTAPELEELAEHLVREGRWDVVPGGWDAL